MLLLEHMLNKPRKTLVMANILHNCTVLLLIASPILITTHCGYWGISRFCWKSQFDLKYDSWCIDALCVKLMPKNIVFIYITEVTDGMKWNSCFKFLAVLISSVKRRFSKNYEISFAWNLRRKLRTTCLKGRMHAFRLNKSGTIY